MSNSLNFNVGGNTYEVSLKQTDRDSLNSVVIGGTKYTVGGEREAIELFKKKTRGFNLASMDLGTLRHRLSALSKAPTEPRVTKSNELGLRILTPTKSVSKEEAILETATQKKSKVLNELNRTWPIPGTNPSVSIRDRMKELNIPGVRLFVINGEESWSQGLGDLEKANCLAQAASLSKNITVLTLMSLLGEGCQTVKGNEINLDTNIQEILDPDLWKSIANPEGDPVTIRQLMSHTGGLEEDTPTGYRGYFQGTAEVEAANQQISSLENERQALEKSDLPDKKERIEKVSQFIVNLEKSRERALKGGLPTLDEILKGEGTNSPPVRVTLKPGSQYAYAGGGAMILQKIIETIAKTNNMKKTTYEDIVEERIFKRLGMEHSTFSPKGRQLAEGHDEDGKSLPGGWVQQPELAAAGLWSIPEDLAKVLIGIQQSLKGEKGGIIKPHLAKDMITPPSKVVFKENEVAGLGVFVAETKEGTYFYHDGSNLGYRCIMIANDKGQGVVIMTNSDAGNELIAEIVRKVADVYEWKGRESLNLRPVPPLHPEIAAKKPQKLDVQKWEGSYANDKNTNAIVTLKVDAGKLFFTPPNSNQDPIEIIPVSEHVGMINENGRWFPIEFEKKQNALVLTVHGMRHSLRPSKI